MARGALWMMAMMAAVVVASASDSCPRGFLLLGRNCYLLHKHYRTQEEAKDYCKGKRGQLASILTKVEFKALLDYISETAHGSYWLSGYNKGDQWRWANNEPMNDQWWGGYVHSNAMCVTLDSNTKRYWPTYCYSQHRAICQADTLQDDATSFFA